MNNKVIYKNVAVGSKSRPPKIVPITDATDPTWIKSDTFANNIFRDVTPANYLTFENDGFDLNRTDQIFASNYTRLGLISNSVSSAIHTINCSFTAAAPVVNNAQVYYSSPGVTITFWQNYCTAGHIKFLKGSVTVAERDFTCDKLVSFIEITAVEYNKVQFTFTETEIPNQFVKIAAINLGRDVVISDLYNFNMLEELNVAGDDLSINTLGFSCESADPLNIQEDQLFYAYNNDVQIGKFNVDTTNEDTDTRYTLSLSDDITLLDKAYYIGGVLNGTSTVKTVIENISTASAVDIEIDSVYENIVLYGWIPRCTCRKALMLVAFAVGAVVDTSRRGMIRMTALNESATPKVIPPGRIIGNAKYSKGDIYTGIELYRYDYSFPETLSNMESVYKNGDTAITRSTSITIYHTKPMWADNAQGIGATISSDANKTTILTMPANTELKRYSFIETKTLQLKYRDTAATSNVKQFPNYTVYSDFDKLSQLYRYYVENNGTVDATIVLDGERVGDMVSIQTKYSGVKTGVIVSLDSKINNNMVAKAVIKCLG